MSAFHIVGPNRVRHLRDGAEAFAAMLVAIDGARRDIFLEMYWVSDDVVGARFRDHLIARARAGVSTFVTYDGVGSFGLFRSFWKPLVAAGGRVVENGPIAPWRHRFRPMRLPFRDHRKLLVVDGEIGFCGGLNLARQWLARDEGGEGWRDDAVEIHGPAALELRTLVRDTWERLGQTLPHEDPVAVTTDEPPRTWVLANRISGGPNRRIRRSYLLAIRRARSSIDIASPYFLPGPLFLRALRAARRRGVRVRVLVPAISDVWLVNLAMLGVIGNLLREDIEVYAYKRAVLHSKTALLDARFVVIGSHNLDTFSWRFDLEANVVVDDTAFAAEFLESFERDLGDSDRLDAAALARPWFVTLLSWVAARFRTFL